LICQYVLPMLIRTPTRCSTRSPSRSRPCRGARRPRGTRRSSATWPDCSGGWWWRGPRRRSA